MCATASDLLRSDAPWKANWFYNVIGGSLPHLLPRYAFTRKMQTCLAGALAVAATAAQADVPAGCLQNMLWLCLYCSDLTLRPLWFPRPLGQDHKEKGA